MSTAHHLILRSVPEAVRPQVAGLLGRAFSLKEATCTAVAGSAPILLLPDLTADEAVAVVFALGPLVRLGVRLDVAATAPADVQKIDWPRRPQIFKRDIAELVQDLELVVDLGGQQAPLKDLIAPRLEALGGRAAPTTTVNRGPTPNQPFRGIQLPEITPFSNPVLPPAASGGSGSGDDAVARLNELFPDDGGFAPSSSDISSILDRILPDEGHPTAPGTGSASGRMAVVPAGGWSLFLPKFADDGRRQKAVPLIAEHGRMSADDAEALSRKMIIPVLKGATQTDAEAARQAFARIGVVAKLKGPE